MAVVAFAVCVCGTVLLLQYEPQNSFTLSIRGHLIRHPLLRTVFDLHNDGDGASDYLGASTKKIEMNVYSMPSEGSIDESVISQLASSVQSVTGKPVTVNTTGEEILADDNPVSDAELNTVLGQYSTPESQVAGDAVLNVFIVSQDSDDQNELGVTFRENGIVLYDTEVINLTTDNPQTLDQYQLSTLLHEFGHQIGLQHNTQPGCLMNPSADIGYAPYVDPSSIPVTFCQYELSEIAAEVAALR